ELFSHLIDWFRFGFRSAILGLSESREETEGDGTIGGGSRS
ncbi:hypothetical protein ACVMIL_011272, partial [Bradyrhizobium barranii subsp. barranii]